MIQQEQQSTIQLIQSINQIDTQIQSLYQNLEQISVTSNPDLNKQQQILDEIQQLQTLKEDLYKNVSDNYASAQANVVEGRNVW